MKKLIVTADDVGFSRDVNRAVQQSRADGVVTCVGVLATGPALEEGVAWARSDPSLGVGIHLDLDRFFRQDHQRPPQEWGFADPRIPVPSLLQEMEAQAGTLLEKGLLLKHMSSRHHLHLRPEILPLVCDVAQKFRIPVVRFFPSYYAGYRNLSGDWPHRLLSKRGLKPVPHFIGGWYWGNVDEHYSVAELACRPSDEDDAGRRELYACIDERLKEHLRRQNVSLITFEEFLRNGA